MGASDWAGRMDQQLEEEFGTPTKRNLRLTALIRWFASNPDYEGLNHRERPAEWDMLTDDLPAVLRDQPGKTIEERWNHLMDELGYQDLVTGGVYLQPWTEFNKETYEPQVSHTWQKSTE